MADAEDLACHIAKTGSKRHAIVLRSHRNDAAGVKSFGGADGRDRVRIKIWRRRADLKPPALLRRRAHAIGDAGMPGENGFQPFAQQHLARGLQPVQQSDGGRVGIGVGGIAGTHVVDGPEGARQRVGPGGGNRLFRKPHDCKSRCQHETLLRSGDSHVHTPVVEPKFHRPDRADAVHKQQRRVRRFVQHPAQAGDIRHHAGRRFVVRDQHGLDLVRGVIAQDLREPVDRAALAPSDIHLNDIEPEPLAHVDPFLAEHAVAGRQHLVARVQRIGQRRFPATSA